MEANDSWLVDILQTCFQGLGSLLAFALLAGAVLLIVFCILLLAWMIRAMWVVLTR